MNKNLKDNIDIKQNYLKKTESYFISHNIKNIFLFKNFVFIINFIYILIHKVNIYKILDKFIISLISFNLFS
jgi:hypothetical protein